MSAAKDLTGQKIGLLNVIERKRENNRTYYYCKCDCGTKKWLRADHLKSDNPSCGCVGRFKAKDIKNKRFGKLVAIAATNDRGDNGSLIWICKCDCGNYKKYLASDLQRGAVVSCGCYQKETRKRNMKKAIRKHVKDHIIDGTNLQVIGRDTPMSNNTSGVTGVVWDSSRNKWYAGIEFKGKRYYLGRYEDKQDAISARKEAESNMFGDFLDWYNKNKNKSRPKRAKDLSGMVFGLLTVIDRAPDIVNRTNKEAVWNCVCKCGEIIQARGALLRRGTVQSCGKCKIYSTNTTGVRGVYTTPNGKWRAMINVDNKLHYLGVFETKEEAIEARIKAEQGFGKTFTGKYNKNNHKIKE